MNRKSLFDSSRILRSSDQWLAILEILRSELSDFLRCPLIATSSLLEEQKLDHASYGIGLDIVAEINKRTQLQYGGVICLSINYDEAVYIDVFFLPFINQRRLFSHDNKLDVLSINYSMDKGWNNPRWNVDGNYEWESYLNMERWLE